MPGVMVMAALRWLHHNEAVAGDPVAGRGRL